MDRRLLKDAFKDDDEDDDAVLAERLLVRLAALDGAACARCAAPLCGHAATLSIALGFQDAPTCAPCLAAALERPVRVFLEEARDRILRRDCFRQGWRWASRREDQGPADHARPPCLFLSRRGPELAPEAASEAAQTGGAPPTPADTWDAGDMSCGDLVLALRKRLQGLASGEALLLRATDPAAPEDIPAWCRLTRNPLAHHDHPRYWIRRKES